ncbi:MAG: hypothetical protein H5T69_00990 [Chloroflexi bacterium]|nr:hypothetical protein [Chloroflexota bacterium]
MAKTQIYYDLRDALGQEGCPICRLTHQASERFLEGLIYEKVNDPKMRAKIRAARGFCREHAWALDRHGASLGVAILLRDVIREIAQDLRVYGEDDEGAQNAWRSLYDRPRSRSKTVAALSSRGECPACAAVREWEQAAYETLFEHLCSGDLMQLYNKSSGLCVPHLLRALDSAPSAAQREALIRAQLPLTERLLHNLDALVRKSDYRFRDELSEAEAVSWLQAIAAIAGERVSSFPEKREDLGR